jgi:hypothetical protein
MTLAFAAREEIFNNARQRWPAKIRLLPDLSPMGNVVTTPCENAIYSDIENAIPENDDWAHIAAWSFHQALGEFIHQHWAQQCHEVETRDVTLDMFDRMMTSNLLHESWSAERAVYHALPRYGA